MSFPDSVEGLKLCGYRFLHATKCKCGADVDYWKTPAGKRIPLDQGTAVLHAPGCPEAKQFRTLAQRKA